MAIWGNCPKELILASAPALPPLSSSLCWGGKVMIRWNSGFIPYSRGHLEICLYIIRAQQNTNTRTLNKSQSCLPCISFHWKFISTISEIKHLTWWRMSKSCEGKENRINQICILDLVTLMNLHISVFTTYSFKPDLSFSMLNCFQSLYWRRLCIHEHYLWKRTKDNTRHSCGAHSGEQSEGLIFRADKFTGLHCQLYLFQPKRDI